MSSVDSRAGRIVVAFVDQYGPRLVGEGDAIQVVQHVVHDAAAKAARDDGQRREGSRCLIIPTCDARAARQNDRVCGWRIDPVLCFEAAYRGLEALGIRQLLSVSR